MRKRGELAAWLATWRGRHPPTLNHPRALDHCVAGHVSAEPGHCLLLEKIGNPALLDLGMRLGEASGATLAESLLKAAVACHARMTTFADAEVSESSR